MTTHFSLGKDIIETDETVIIRINLAGVKKENIDIKVTETNLRVTAEFEDEHSDDAMGYNRRPALIKRSARFPKKVLAEEANAKFENGLLIVEVPKLEKKESFTVDIN